MKNIFKNRTYVIVFILFLVSSLFGAIGIALVVSEKEPKGIYFRKLYGYIGVDAAADGFLNLPVLNFGRQNMEFFDDVSYFAFDTDCIKIKEITIESVFKEKSFEMFDMKIRIQSVQDGISNITKLLYNGSDRTSQYYLGLVAIQSLSVNKDRPPLNYSAETQFYYDQYNFSITSSTLSIVITDILFEHDKIVDSDYKTKLPAQSTVGTTMELNFGVNFVVDEFDIFILQPIIKFYVSGQDIDYFLFVAVQTQYNKPMTIPQMREYIKNA